MSDQPTSIVGLGTKLAEEAAKQERDALVVKGHADQHDQRLGVGFEHERGRGSGGAAVEVSQQGGWGVAGWFRWMLKRK